MARDAPVHEQGFVLISERHLVKSPMAGDAADALIYVNVMIEVNKLGQIVDPLPRNGFATAIAGSNRFEDGAAEPNLLMAIHAGLGRRNPGKGGVLDGG